MTLATLLVFSLVALIAIITPGPTVLLALANGSRHGVRRALPGMLGALLAASEFWFSVVKWAGAAYLAWLGLRMLRSRGGSLSAPQGESGAGGYSARTVLLKSFLVAVTNPKGYLFCSALLPQFIDPAAAQAPQYLAIALVFALIDFLVMLAYAFAGSRAARLLRGQAVLWLDRLCGGMLLALAGSLAFYRRATN
jgi:threonine/homoserine/homoserine lactone efflux protein